MKIGIHSSGPGSFSERWISYCKSNSIPFKIVNCYETNITEQLSDCDILMWHHNHVLAKDVLIAKQVLNAFEGSGRSVFPNFNSAWHFDDKLGQKYLLELIGAPLVPTHVFFSKTDALKWIQSAEFPKVFKLRGGGGAKNVRLVKDKDTAKRLIKRAYSIGFRQYNPWFGISEQWRKFKLEKTQIKGLLKALAHFIYPIQLEKVRPRERGYIYFQDFISGNNSDTRVVVIGNKAFAIKRYIRKNDFRASGSGNITYSKNEIDIACVKLAFELNDRLKAQCLAFDFVHES